MRQKIPTLKKHVILSCFFQGVGGNLEAVLAGRFFVGLSLGMEGSIHSMYICEIVSKRYRGPMVASGVVVINFGFLLVYILGSFTHWQVRVGSVLVDISELRSLILVGISQYQIWLMKYDFADHSVGLQYISIVGISRNLHNTRVSSMVGKT